MLYRFFFFLLVIFLLEGCETVSDKASLEVSQEIFAVDGDASVLRMEITSTSEWVVSSNSSWCTPDMTTGRQSASVKLHIMASREKTERVAVVSIRSGAIIREVRVYQKPTPLLDLDTHHYKLPVIFHVLYVDENNPKQHPPASRFKEMIDRCNELFQGADMNLEFVLAATSPTKEVLPQSGVDYVKWSTSVMDANKFMGVTAESEANVKKLLWDLDEYINIMVYTFADSKYAGWAHTPLSLKSSYLEGLEEVDYVVRTSNLNYLRCISLNNSYISYLNVTLPHELGHYLGLFHAFSRGLVCGNTDYCDDTPDYNRDEYDKWALQNPGLPYSDLVVRKQCNGTSFTSYNIMDYSPAYRTRFTPDQVRRVRHVLANSPLIPGPKKENRTRAPLLKGVQALPQEVIGCFD